MLNVDYAHLANGYGHNGGHDPVRSHASIFAAQPNVQSLCREGIAV